MFEKLYPYDFPDCYGLSCSSFSVHQFIFIFILCFLLLLFGECVLLGPFFSLQCHPIGPVARLPQRLSIVLQFCSESKNKKQNEKYSEPKNGK